LVLLTKHADKKHEVVWVLYALKPILCRKQEKNISCNEQDLNSNLVLLCFLLTLFNRSRFTANAYADSHHALWPHGCIQHRANSYSRVMR